MSDLELYLASALAASVVGNVLFIATLQEASKTIDYLRGEIKELSDYIWSIHNEQ